MPVEGPRCQAHGATYSPGGVPPLLVRENTCPVRPLQPHFREKTRPARPLQPHFREEVPPARHKTPILSHFSCAGRTFSRLHDDYSAAGRTFARSHPHTRQSRANNIAHSTRKHGDVETNNTTAHPQQGTYETRITSAPEKHAKTPISHPQRRWRFQTTRPPGRQIQAAAPAGPEAMSGPAISHLAPPTRTLTR